MTELRERISRLPKAPVEGWISLVGILVLTLTLAWSIDGAAWVLGRDQFTDFLALTVGWGIAIGFIGAKVGWGRWPTYLLGSLLAALIVPLYVGDVLKPEATWLAQYEATATSLVEAWRDLALRNQSVTQEYGHFLLTLGLFTWATAMYAAYTTFGHRRPLNAIVLVGIVLVANMGFTYQNQLMLLVLFSLAALFLLIRFHAFDEESEWLRRRIGDPSAVSQLYLRGGSVFIAIAVVGSLFLTNTASSSPLAGAVRGVGDQLVVLSRDFQRFLPTGGANRPMGVDFGSTAPITGQWVTRESEAFSVQFEKPEDENLYWRAAVYDTFEQIAWRRTVAGEYDVPATEAVLDASGDRFAEAGRRPVTFRVFPADYRASAIVSPQSPAALDTHVRVSYVGDAKFLATVDHAGGDPYTVTALVRTTGDDQDGSLTINRLRAAGTSYPPQIVKQYLGVPRGCHPGGRRRGAAPRRHPCRGRGPGQPVRRRKHDGRLHAVVGQLQVRRRRPRPRLRGPVDRRVLRPLPQGLLPVLRDDDGDPAPSARHPDAPGCRVPAGQTRCANSSSACPSAPRTHGSRSTSPGTAGWSSTRRAVVLPPRSRCRPANRSRAGRRRASHRSCRRASAGASWKGMTVAGANGPGGLATRPGPSAALIVVAILLAVIVGALAFVVYRRGPRGEVTPDKSYATLTRLAGRLGFGPRPTQTVYEYALALGEVLPQSRPEIQTVAQAKVEVAYGRRMLGEDRMAALREAHRRLRVGLLRLMFRRTPRRRR